MIGYFIIFFVIDNVIFYKYNVFFSSKIIKKKKYYNVCIKKIKMLYVLFLCIVRKFIFWKNFKMLLIIFNWVCVVYYFYFIFYFLMVISNCIFFIKKYFLIGEWIYLLGIEKCFYL